MKRITSFTIISVLIICLLCIQSTCFAQNMLRKVGRGVANIATSAFEIPISIQEKFYSDGPMAACTYGLVDGIYKLIRRTVVGAYEIITFPIPFPADYAPIVEPEFLFAPEEPYSF